MSQRTVAILGLGLMGGSLAKALRGLPDPPDVRAWAPGPGPSAAFAEGVIDEMAASASLAVQGAGLVVLATPVSAALALLPEIAQHAPAAVVTDVCSVKAPLVAAAAAAGLRFVGAHPLAGSHESGWAAARADLYRGATVFVVPGAPEDTAVVEAFFDALGAVTERIEAAAHDRLMAWVSHAPQLVASGLGATLAAAGVPSSRLGPAGQAMTRLAASDPDLWTDILLHNPAVGPALQAVRAHLAELSDAIDGRDGPALRTALETAHRWKAGS